MPLESDDFEQEYNTPNNGIRTGIMESSIGTMDVLIVNNEIYRILKSHVDFSKYKTFENTNYILSIGAFIDPSREVLYLDPKSIKLDEIYQQLKLQLQTKNLNLLLISNKELFQQVINFVRSQFPTAHEMNQVISDSPSNFYLPNITVQLKRISIEEFLEHGGVCRHHALLACYLLGRLVQEKITVKGNVYHCRDNMLNEGHAWVIYRIEDKDELWLVDTLWNKVFNLNDSADREKACKDYTNETIEGVIKRFQPIPTKSDPLPSIPVDKNNILIKGNNKKEKSSEEDNNTFYIIRNIFEINECKPHQLTLNVLDILCKSEEDSFLSIATERYNPSFTYGYVLLQIEITDQLFLEKIKSHIKHDNRYKQIAYDCTLLSKEFPTATILKCRFSYPKEIEVLCLKITADLKAEIKGKIANPLSDIKTLNNIYQETIRVCAKVDYWIKHPNEKNTIDNLFFDLLIHIQISNANFKIIEPEEKNQNLQISTPAFFKKTPKLNDKTLEQTNIYQPIITKHNLIKFYAFINFHPEKDDKGNENTKQVKL